MNIENPVLVITAKKASGMTQAVIMEESLSKKLELEKYTEDKPGFQVWKDIGIGVGANFVCVEKTNDQFNRIRSLLYFMDNYRIDLLADVESAVIYFPGI